MYGAALFLQYDSYPCFITIPVLCTNIFSYRCHGTTMTLLTAYHSCTTAYLLHQLKEKINHGSMLLFFLQHTPPPKTPGDKRRKMFLFNMANKKSCITDAKKKRNFITYCGGISKSILVSVQPFFLHFCRPSWYY